MTQPTNLPVPATSTAAPAPTDAPAAPSIFGDVQMALWSSLPMDTPERRLAVVNLLQGPTRAAGDMIGETLEVAHVLAHRVNGVDDDGVEWEGDRIIMVSPDGQATECVSEGIRRSLSLLMMAAGAPPWSPPLRVKIVQENTRRGRRVYRLHVVTAAKPAK